MDHDHIASLKQHHPTLQLLNAHNAALIISFTYEVFIAPNRRAISESELEARLSDTLYHMSQLYGEARYPQSAKAYLEAWAGDGSPYLRKFYTQHSDEPFFDIMPGTERAIEWLKSLEPRSFVGTETRLREIHRLLKELVDASVTDPQERIAELEMQREAIDAQILKLRSGALDIYDPVQIKERLFLLEDGARKLMGDFRQIEHNFRELDRATREQIASSDMEKGAVLDHFFSDHDVIWNSEQGLSFNAFWEFLMSPASQAEFRALVERAAHIEEVRVLEKAEFLFGIIGRLIEAGETVYKSSASLAEQLKRFLASQGYVENRRIMELIKRIEQYAVECADDPPRGRAFCTIDETRPEF